MNKQSGGDRAGSQPVPLPVLSSAAPVMCHSKQVCLHFNPFPEKGKHSVAMKFTLCVRPAKGGHQGHSPAQIVSHYGYFFLFKCACTCVYVWACTCHSACVEVRGQLGGGWFSPSTTRGSGIELMSLGLAADLFIH